MALKPLRNVIYDDISMFLNETADRGVILIFDSTVSGLGGMDDANNMAKIPTNSGGNPVGMLMEDMVDVDQTKFHLNAHQDEVQKGGKVRIAKKGFVVTNAIEAGVNPVPGSGAYFTTNGYLTMFTDALVNPTVSLSGNLINVKSTVANAKVGTFASSRDADGYVKVDLNL